LFVAQKCRIMLIAAFRINGTVEALQEKVPALQTTMLARHVGSVIKIDDKRELWVSASVDESASSQV